MTTHAAAATEARSSTVLLGDMDQQPRAGVRIGGHFCARRVHGYTHSVLGLARSIVPSLGF